MGLADSRNGSKGEDMWTRTSYHLNYTRRIIIVSLAVVLSTLPGNLLDRKTCGGEGSHHLSYTRKIIILSLAEVLSTRPVNLLQKLFHSELLEFGVTAVLIY